MISLKTQNSKLKTFSLIALLVLLATTAVLAFDPATYNLTMQAGEDFRLVLTLKDSTGAVQNLSGYTYAAQYRSTFAPSGSVYATYSANVLSPTAGTVSVRLSKAQTTALTGTQGVWDLLQTDTGGAASFLLKGKALVAPTVTR